jgi:hypothetical protein
MNRSAQSPPLLIRNSERGSFKRCRQNWYWNFVEQLKTTEEAPALRFGDLIHQSLERHYPPGVKRRGKPWLIFEKLYDEQLRKGQEEFRMWAEDESWVSAKELGITMMRGFYDLYHDKDEAFEVIASEQVFQIPLRWDAAHRKELRAIYGRVPKVTIVGTMDGIWRPRSGRKKERLPFIKEYKTTGSSISHVVAGLPMDEQAGTYWTFGPIWLWKMGVLAEGEYPTHIWYTIMRKAMDDDREKDELGRALNKNGTISKKQPAPRFDRIPVYRDAHDRARQYVRVQDEAVEMLMARSGHMAIIKNPGPLFMPNCTNCAFRGPCELHESGQDYEVMIRAMYKKWSPYAAHEIPERW